MLAAYARQIQGNKSTTSQNDTAAIRSQLNNPRRKLDLHPGGASLHFSPMTNKKVGNSRLQQFCCCLSVLALYNNHVSP